MSLNGGLFPTTSEPERASSRGSSEDDRATRHAPPADPGSGSGIPRRESGDRPSTANPHRGLRVRGGDRTTVRLRRAIQGRQGPAAPLPDQGDRPVAGPGHPPAAPIPDHRRGHHRRGAPRQPFPRRYTPTDIGRLAELDALHGTLSGPTTRKLCARAFHRFGDPRFERLAAISNGHLYNLRHSITYQRRRGTVPAPTRSVQIAIGERRRPQPFGQPGHVRVDTVHQGDLDGVKGLYHLNLVDEVTQFQFIGSVEYIQAACLKPVLEALLRAFPFILHGFHADNGSEFINRDVAALLEAMHIDAFTKSRARRCTDNALVESKNGSVIRKHLGYGHIPNRYAERVHAFNQQFLSPYLNFHRPCFFPSEEVDAKGRVRKRYRDADIMTPYEKLKSLPNAAACLKPGTTFAELDAAASATSDNEAARALNQARDRLFASIDPAA